MIWIFPLAFWNSNSWEWYIVHCCRYCASSRTLCDIVNVKRRLRMFPSCICHQQAYSKHVVCKFVASEKYVSADLHHPTWMETMSQKCSVLNKSVAKKYLKNQQQNMNTVYHVHSGTSHVAGGIHLCMVCICSLRSLTYISYSILHSYQY